MENRLKPISQLRQLNFLVGKWNSEGTTRATASSPSIEIKGTDSYEWVLGGFFLLHRVDVLLGNEKVEVIEIIGGYDDSGKSFLMRSFDNLGNFTTMQASVKEAGVLRINGEKMRSELVLHEEGNQMTAKWELSEDGSNWMHWMDMKFRK